MKKKNGFNLFYFILISRIIPAEYGAKAKQNKTNKLQKI